jgi:ubiquinone/menaquinone biosynthesis C-methylase UbiE
MFERFAHRSRELERLDTGDYTPEEYEKWLGETKLINRWLGDVRALRSTLEREEWVRAERVSILDVGAGSGELLKSAQEMFNGRAGLLVGAELNPAAVRAISARRAEFGVAALQCNGLKLPFQDDSFDLVVCSLLLHHLTDPQAVGLIAEVHRVAKKQFVVIDLFRGPVPYYLYRIFSPLFLQRMTVEDGSLSILRAFRPEELIGLAERAGVRDAVVRRAAFRLILSAVKR